MRAASATSSDAAAQVDAVRAHRQRDVDPVVDVERDARRARDRRAAFARELGQRAAGQILLAELDRDLAPGARPVPAMPRSAAATTSVSGRPPVACRSVTR